MIGKTIKRLRIARALSKSELARRVRVSATAVHNWEEYGTIPRDDTLSVIAAVLGTTVATLTGKPATGTTAKTPKDSAAAMIEYKEKIAELFGVQPDQVEVSINF